MTVGSRLSERLRGLREGSPGLTQKQLARVLGGEGTMVSMWETGRRVPPTDRLTAYARLFAAQRSFTGSGPPRLIDDEDLSEEERRRFEELERELLDLRDEAQRSGDGSRLDLVPQSSVFGFSDGTIVTIICADVPQAERPKFADITDLNYVRASSFADLDAVIDAFGHLRAENPNQEVRIRAASELKKEEMKGHLVVIGGRAWNEATRWFSDRVGLPVKQRRREQDEDVFVVKDDDTEHEFGIERGDDKLLTQDVGLFARTPNPQDPSNTLTICSGITTRGVRGVVQCFSDPGLRRLNEFYVATRFDHQTSFGLLFKVEVYKSGESLAPDLSLPETRLFEWVNDEAGPG
jgi:transcriptional regulator with XRE-family HTH domain